MADPASYGRTSNNKLSKGMIIMIIAIIVIVLAIVIFMTVRSLNRRREQQELENQMAELQQQANDPNVPTDQRQGLWNAMAGIAQRIRALRGTSDSEPSEIDVFWSGNGSGICASSGVLNKARTLKKGVNSMEVCQLQLLLNKRGAKLPIDGKFSAQTEAALKMAANNRTSITLAQIPKSYWG